MGEVIQVNFRTASRTRNNWMLQRFADMLAEHGLDDDDIADVLDGIFDYEHYKSLDDVGRHIVDIWHQHTSNL